MSLRPSIDDEESNRTSVPDRKGPCDGGGARVYNIVYGFLEEEVPPVKHTLYVCASCNRRFYQRGLACTEFGKRATPYYHKLYYRA